MIKKYKCYIHSFFICAASMMIFLFLSVYNKGFDNTLIVGDAQELYMTALKSLVTNIWQGNSLNYSWSLSMGMNATEYYTAVVGGSIINTIYYIFPFIELELFMYISIIVKGGLCGVTFVIFSKHVLKVDEKTGIIFSIFYALCGFQTSINVINFIWMDMVYMLPLILYFIVEFIEKKRFLCLCLAYAYMFLCNFYIAYIVGFFSAIFLILYLVIYSPKNKIQVICKFTCGVILAAGITAFALLPTAIFLINRYHIGSKTDYQSPIANNILIYISRFLWGQAWSDEIRYPYVYCGLLIFVLIVLFYINKKIEFRDKILYSLLLFIMVISCFIHPFYIFWHGFDEPDMWYYRFAFIISFLCLVMSCKAFYFIKEFSKETIIKVTLVSVILIIVSGEYSFYKIHEPKSIFIIINILFILIWTFFFITYKKSKLLYVFFVCLAMLEVISNGCIGHSIYQSKSEFKTTEEEMKDVLEILNQDTEFYRINNDNRILVNSDTYFGYKGISDFCSFENQELRELLMKLGGYTSSRIMKGHGLNEFTQMILNVKYNVKLSGGINSEEEKAGIYMYPRVLNIGFMVDDDIRNVEFGQNVYQNNNNLASAMMGERISLFTPVPEEQISVIEDGITIKKEDGYYLYNDTNDNTNTLTYSVPYEGKNAYITFGSYNRGIMSNGPLIWEPDSGKDNAELTVRYTKQMEYDGEKLICNIIMKQDITGNEGYYDQLECYYLNSEILDILYETLKKEQLQIEKYQNGYLKGSVNVKDNQRILFTSIPYDEGWKVKSNKGEVQTLSLLDGAFLGVSFSDTGIYDLEFVYEAPGLKVGCVISLVSFLIVVILSVKKKRG